MGTDKVAFVVVLCGGATGSHMTGSDVPESDVSHVPEEALSGSMLRMRNGKFRNIHHSGNPNNPVVILRFAILTPERLSR
jgi:hypothetical protein